MRRHATTLVGAVLALLGLLWFLQGADVVHMRPVLCFADCTYVSHGSKLWEAIGALAAIVGVAIMGWSLKTPRRR
jgi:hypothetical protein